MRASKKTIIVLLFSIAVIFGIAGLIYASFESQALDLQNSYALLRVHRPSAVLLFGMGLLGILCVVINEKIKKHKTVKMKRSLQKPQNSKSLIPHFHLSKPFSEIKHPHR
jgi:hypothetical protein